MTVRAFFGLLVFFAIPVLFGVSVRLVKLGFVEFGSALLFVTIALTVSALLAFFRFVMRGDL